MWSSDLSRRGRVAAGLALALAALSACTAGPLYGGRSVGGAEVSASTLQPLRGRIAIVEANTRTDQIVRNELLSRLNAGARVRDPLYSVQLVTTGIERGITIEPGGIASSAIYDLSVAYTVTRLSDNQVIDTGRRQVITPFDRTAQLFQSQRALLDARRQSGRSIAAELEIAIATALVEEGR
ncbi:hypothetical protein DYI37_15045 [Fulvimarina endophytica]|uniref:LPS-assembly lipoprotein n=1 Tax=Fulvimarina endophytica TaxID=2293836 RepID=A0A371X044_9HYPH|nr:hypothetical protein [Fulvimarina endophytica]RFC62566.1 hypothetical protein DYI37_15045 [Fulvimarina endophytica]